MTRRTFAEVEAAARADERRAVVAHADRYCQSVDALIGRGGVAAEEAQILKDRVRAFALGIGAGLHIEDGHG